MLPRVLWVSLLVAGCSTEDNTRSFESRLLATIPEETTVKAITFSRDGNVAAYISKRKGADRVVMGDHPGKAYHFI